MIVQEKKTISFVHVDDIIITGDDTDELLRLKNVLSKEFIIKHP